MNVAFIPVRGGSKSIPLKNIRSIGGKPLVYWCLKAACQCSHIDRVYVSTDSEQIRETVQSFRTEECIDNKVEVVARSAETASDNATTESAMLEFAGYADFDNIVLIQATSPLISKSDLDRGFEAFDQSGVDSVLSVVRQKRFVWSEDEDGYVQPDNYDYQHRPRRQEFSGYLVENGAFYITSKEALLRSGNRISGHIKAVEMREETYYEIDEPHDWVIIESLMGKNSRREDISLADIKMVLTDCDGCLTDGGMYYSEKGDELKKFNTRDGMGFALLRQKGILTGIITSESVSLNKRRADKLQLDVFVDGCKDKLAAIKEICNKYDLALSNVCYVGDDINDLTSIRSVGFGCCPADAIQDVKKQARFVTKAKGGDGVLREVIEEILKRRED